MYRVEASTSLTSGAWSALGGDVTATQTYVARQVVKNPAQPQGFYRVRKVL